MNKILYKDTYKGYDVCISETDYGAILGWHGCETYWGGSSSAFWGGGFEDLTHAKKVILAHIDSDIELNIKTAKARKAYDDVMAQ